jgi:hypothetical protein
VNSHRSYAADEMQGLGANERALLGRIRWGAARRLANDDDAPPRHDVTWRGATSTLAGAPASAKG